MPEINENTVRMEFWMPASCCPGPEFTTKRCETLSEITMKG